MTTLVGLRGKDFVILGSDSQVSEGNLKVPFPQDKILRVGDVLIGGTGSLGDLQQLLKRALRELYVSKIISDDYDVGISPTKLSNALADMSFDLRLSFKTYEPFSYMIGGVEETAFKLFTIEESGSVLDIPNFYSDGTGKALALSSLSQGYHPDITKEQAVSLAFTSLLSSGEFDIFTDNLCRVFLIDKEGIQPCKFEIAKTRDMEK